MKRCLTIAVVVVLLLAGLVTILWTALDWPPPQLILKYGFPPQGGPTGRVRKVAGMNFVEVRRGYFKRPPADHVCYSNVCACSEDTCTCTSRPHPYPLSLVLPARPAVPGCWIEVPGSFLLGTSLVPRELLVRFWEENMPAVEVFRVQKLLKSGELIEGCEISFTDWVSEVIGQNLRLPTFDEWEFLHRCGRPVRSTTAAAFVRSECPWCGTFLTRGGYREDGSIDLKSLRLVWLPPEED